MVREVRHLGRQEAAWQPPAPSQPPRSTTPRNARVQLPVLAAHKLHGAAGGGEARGRRYTDPAAALRNLRLAELRKRALSAGMAEAVVQRVLDSEEPRAAMVELLLVGAGPVVDLTYSTPAPRSDGVAS